MILEGIVTTVDLAGATNIAPMGPVVDASMDSLLLRPFNTSQTYRNLREHGEGVFHVVDDVLLLARAAVGKIEPPPRLIDTTEVRGSILADACRFYEFRVESMDEREERVRIDVRVVRRGRRRDFFGFNRAKHAVLEAAILATRVHFLPLDEIKAEFRKLSTLVDKTGGQDEREAFAFLQRYVGDASG